jgi:hypothetical protein
VKGLDCRGRLLRCQGVATPQVGQYLLAEMMPLFKARPQQCWDAMTRRLIRKTDGAAKG